MTEPAAPTGPTAAARILDVFRADAWINAITGLGTLRDKLTNTKIGQGRKLADHELERLYSDDDISTRIVDKVPREALRNGWECKFNALDRAKSAEQWKACASYLDRLDCDTSLLDAWIWGRLFGGGAILVGAEDGQAVDQPLNETNVSTIRFLHVLDRRELRVRQTYEDPRAPKYGRPELYDLYELTKVVGGNVRRLGITVHESRLITFGGAHTTKLRRMSNIDGWDDSILQRCYEAMQQSVTAWMSTAHLMTDASQGVLKVANLAKLVAKEGESVLRTRIQFMDLARSVARVLLVDAEHEGFERVATSFTGMPELLDRFMMRVAATAEMPCTMLFGRSPAGMNATGESDTRNWYQVVQEAQRSKLKPRIVRLLTLVMLAKDGPTGGKVLDNWEVCFPPPWQQTKKEESETREKNANAIATLVREQVLLPEEGAIELANSGDFVSIDVEARQAALQAQLEGDDDEGVLPGTGGDDVQKTAFNGTQVAAMIQIVTSVAQGQLPRESGLAMLLEVFPITATEAEDIMSTVGKGFEPKALLAPTPRVSDPNEPDDDDPEPDDE